MLTSLHRHRLYRGQIWCVGFKSLFRMLGFMKCANEHAPECKHWQPAIIVQLYFPAKPGLHAHHPKIKLDWGIGPAMLLHSTGIKRFKNLGCPGQKSRFRTFHGVCWDLLNCETGFQSWRNTEPAARHRIGPWKNVRDDLHFQLLYCANPQRLTSQAQHTANYQRLHGCEDQTNMIPKTCHFCWSSFCTTTLWGNFCIKHERWPFKMLWVAKSEAGTRTKRLAPLNRTAWKGSWTWVMNTDTTKAAKFHGIAGPKR